MPKARWVVDWVSRLGLTKPTALFLRAVLRASTPTSIPSSAIPDALVVYTSVNSYFSDDLVREARQKKIPLIAITNNWDNLSNKAFMETPPYLGVWGQQGFLIARTMHLMLPHRLFLVGAPRFEIYRNARVTREVARAKLGAPPNGRVLLFCGAGVAFEEASLLEELEAAIGDGRLPADLHVLYKPHPIRFDRASERKVDFSHTKHLTLVQSNRTLSELQIYPYLMCASDGLISPFSTMVMEGAHHGLPALCLGYNDSGHANYDWGRAAFSLHLYTIRLARWAVICASRSEFLESCRALVRKMDDPSCAASARAGAAMVFENGPDTVGERIAAAILRISNGLDADDSYLASLSAMTVQRMTSDADGKVDQK